MKIEHHPVNDGVIRLAVTGEIDFNTADELYDAVTVALTHARAADIVVDLADVIFCDSAGIDAILRARTHAARHGTSLQVINPHGIVHRALDLTGALDAVRRRTHHTG